MTSARFEGSFLGDTKKIGDDAILECKICWYSYDPAVGDDIRQIPPGTPFSALPGDWRCPHCDGARDQFMVIDSDPPSPASESPLARDLVEKPKQLTESFRQVFNTKMRDTPFSNNSLNVEAIGFRIWENRIVGILMMPWCMNIVVLPATDEDWSQLRIGTKRNFAFPSGCYEFIFNNRPPAGGYFACSLFSSMAEFASQLQATDVARAAIAGLFDEGNLDEDTDRTADISAMRQAELASAAEREAARAASSDETATAHIPANPSRRALISAGLADSPKDPVIP
ncbi:rubredoxin HupJ (plasmid) [Afipia carboxidovorans OM5]|uniref:Rubredoxin HupJ n=1 Tax=Afipia carboxidovorans (strain ATCC 49405 / DSM 1227 / KCTC 32145 / OM5) TaxID=504832 RepID=F8C121_AFIC5|nr:[NiFe]-hydrogenase assembly chaperone HybE [Afipia carboxidovorans]AEI04503.1 rubredoxin HupJ [Afipia carboxidovorans OM4]AEI08131.1 rubredoxin HupJ [Afipia carboxidovorans OM5]